MEVLSDRYELRRTLGAGGMARVVEAYDRLLDRHVAVKLMRDDLSTDPAVRERFLREARSAAKFAHPNAVAVYDTGQDGRQPWIVMELVSGGTLADRLAEEGALPPSEAVHVADAVLAALAAAHRNGLIHRDVKPANILLPEGGGVKLTDFGIAKGVQEVTAGLTATGQIIGTAKYLSPEQVSGRPATPASDVYALGVVLYEMLTGQPPFTGDSAIAVALAHQQQPVPPLSGVDPGLAATVQRALAKDPAERYADAQAMRDALAGRREAAAAATVPIGAVAATAVLDDREPAAVRAPVGKGPRRSAAPWLLAGLVLLALLAALALAGVSRMADDPGAGRQAGRTPAAGNERRGAAAPGGGQRASEPAATEAPAAEEPSPAAPEPEPEPTTEAPVIVAGNIPELIALLADNPDAFGERQPDLLDGLVDVEQEQGPKRAEEAAKLQEDVAGWVDDGELDATVGGLAIDLLQPLTEQLPPEDDKDAEEEDDGPGERGRGERNGGPGKGGSNGGPGKGGPKDD